MAPHLIFVQTAYILCEPSILFQMCRYFSGLVKTSSSCGVVSVQTQVEVIRWGVSLMKKSSVLVRVQELNNIFQ